MKHGKERWMGRPHHGSIAARATRLGAGLFLLACTEFEAGTDELEASTEMLDQLPASGGDWSCLGDSPAPLLDPGTVGSPITYGLRLVDIANGNPFPGVTVRACGLTDIECEAPITDRLGTDAEGWVDIPLTENFAGYLEVESPTSLPYVFYLPNERLRTMRDYPLVVISEQSFAALRAALGVGDMPELGTISTRNFDCTGNPAAATVLLNNTGGVPFYFINGLPNITSRETDGAGLAGFANAPTGVTQLEVRRGDGALISRKSVIVRAGWLTGAFMRPIGGGDP
jgi:hypothetical protein